MLSQRWVRLSALPASVVKWLIRLEKSFVQLFRWILSLILEDLSDQQQEGMDWFRMRVKESLQSSGLTLLEGLVAQRVEMTLKKAAQQFRWMLCLTLVVLSKVTALDLSDFELVGHSFLTDLASEWDRRMKSVMCLT